MPESTSKESKGQMIDLTTEKSAEQVDLTNGDDKTDSKAEDDKIDSKAEDDKADGKAEDAKTDEAKTDEAKTDEGKPEESDSTASRKRPREDEGTYLLLKCYYVNASSNNYMYYCHS